MSKCHQKTFVEAKIKMVQRIYGVSRENARQIIARREKEERPRRVPKPAGKESPVKFLPGADEDGEMARLEKEIFG